MRYVMLVYENTTQYKPVKQQGNVRLCATFYLTSQACCIDRYIRHGFVAHIKIHLGLVPTQKGNVLCPHTPHHALFSCVFILCSWMGIHASEK